MRRRLLLAAPALVALALVAGCEQLGIDDPVKIAEKRDAEGRAVGSACRHSGRALEDCYELNSKASKAAIFAGWREMDGYMRENQIPNAVPQLVEGPTAGAAVKAEAAAEEPAAAEAGKEAPKEATKEEAKDAAKEAPKAEKAPATSKKSAARQGGAHGSPFIRVT